MEEKIEGMAEGSSTVGDVPAVEVLESTEGKSAGDTIRIKVGGEEREVKILSVESTTEPAELGPADKPVLADSPVAGDQAQAGQPTDEQPEQPTDPLLAMYQAGKPLTEKQLRVLRGRYFTVKHQEIECGHKFDLINEPRNNCERCWFMWYNTHGQLCQSMDQAYHEKGVEFLIGMRGKKAVKMFLKFMSTLAAWQTQMANAQAQAAAQGGTDGQERSGSTPTTA